MAHKEMLIAFSMIAAASPLAATQPEVSLQAPAAAAGARYCLRVESVTGSRIETIQCWTREKWVEQGVDVDKEWAKEGVRVIG